MIEIVRFNSVRIHKVFAGYFLAFHFLGQSSYDPRRSHEILLKKNICEFLPTLGVWFFSSALSVFSICYCYLYFQVHDSYLLLSVIWFILEQVLAVSNASTSLCLHRVLPKICQDFVVVERLLCENFGITVHLETFKRTFRLRLFSVLVVFSVIWCCKRYLKTRHADVIMETVYFVQCVITALPLFHVLFYVGILRQFLEDFNDYVSHVVPVNRCAAKIAVLSSRCTKLNLRDWQQTYFQICSCSRRISQYFGWILFTTFLYNFYHITWTMYWLFLTIYDGEYQLLLLRNFWVSFDKAVSILQRLLSSSAGPLINFTGAFVTTNILIKECDSIEFQVIYRFSFYFSKIEVQKYLQKSKLIKSIENLSLWTNRSVELQHERKAMASQIRNMELLTTARGFFTINRKLQVQVSLTTWLFCGDF